MSGICGIVIHNNASRLCTTQLLAMVRALAKSETSDSFTENLGSVGMGVNGFPGRLAGTANLTLHGKRVVLAFYGDLYDLGDLFSLEEKKSDPFVGLLHLYLKEGMGFLQRLRGEFALAIWDERKEALHLASDRFRVHPVFYYQDQDKLVFASRMRGILACPLLVKQTINLTAIVDVATSSIIPTPKTIFREVKKLPPGYVLTYCKGELHLAPYWEISFLQSDTVAEAELARKLKDCFTESLSIRSGRERGAKQIGTFLSGGVDSSTVTGVLTQLLGHPIKSFSIGFNEERFNEMEYAQIAARAFGAEHYTYFVTPRDTYEALPVLLDNFDEPFANASAVPTYFCAKLAREQGVAVLYAGDGGDELFAGNERYATQRIFDHYYRIPVWLQALVVKPIVFALADRLRWNLFIKGKKYIRRATIPYAERISSYGILNLMPMEELFDDGILEEVGSNYNPDAVVSDYYNQAPACTDLDRHLYIDLKLAISDNDLFKVKRMSEAAGVAVHFPFLDHRLAEFAATVPADIKMCGTQLRSFFKKAYADLLPAETRAKQKHGFGLPIPTWLRTDRRLNELMHELLLSPQSLQRGYFRKKSVERLVACHKTDETSFYGTVIWNLMILELWHRHYSTAFSQ